MLRGTLANPLRALNLSRLSKPGWSRAIALAALAALIALRIWDPVWLEVLRYRVFDAYQQVKPRVVTETPVTIVDIDEKSLKELGQWPWPRTLLADLVARLADAGTATIALDIILAEPDRMSPALIATTTPGLDPETRARLGDMPANEVVLANAMRRSRVVLAQAGQPGVTAAQPDNALGTNPATKGGDPRPYLIDFPGLLRNRPELEAAAAGRGLITFRSDRDGVVRRVPAVMVAEGRIVPGFAIEVLRVATGAGTPLVRRDAFGLHSVVVAGNEIVIDRIGHLWLHHSRHTPARYLSAADVLTGRADPARLRGKLALVGSSSVTLFDLKTTPLERVMPGVEIHAQVIENILSKSLLSRPYYAVDVEIAAALVMGLAVILLVPMLGAVPVLLLGFASAGLFAGGSWYLFDKHRLLIDVVFPLMSTFIVFSCLAYQNYFREEARRNAIRAAFSRYISPVLVEQLAKNPNRLVLGGETRELTVLFSDVRGFTSVAEGYKHDPQGLTALMNRLLTPLTDAIIDQRGTIDKYMGDAILAFWNAPLDVADHSRRACLAALEMLRRIDRLNAERRDEMRSQYMPFVPIKVGIGLNTGSCVVGNMGSDLRFDYSVLGDSVNVASRIENLTRTYGVAILLGATTVADGAADLAVLAVDKVRVKGKAEPETIYALVGDAEIAASTSFKAAAAAFAEMRSAYMLQDWTKARQHVDLARAADSSGHLSGLLDLFRQRIDAFEVAPPPADWEGVYVMQEKSSR